MMHQLSWQALDRHSICSMNIKQSRFLWSLINSENCVPAEFYKLNSNDMLWWLISSQQPFFFFILMIILYNHVNMFIYFKYCEQGISFIILYHSWDRMNIEDLNPAEIQNHDNVYPVVTPLITDIMISGRYFYV